MLVDSHCHLDHLDLPAQAGALDDALDGARAEAVTGFLCIGADPQDHERVLDIARQRPDVWATVGVHPLAVAGSEAALDEQLRRTEALLTEPHVVGLGETGLDYHQDDGPAAPLQRAAFVRHLQLGARHGLPVVVHTRAAAAETLALIREHADGEHVGVLHCFAEDLDTARAAIELGWYISISGIVTFRNAQALRDVVRVLPLERLLVETDAPWLAPAPHRGQANEPRHVRRVAECIAALREVPLEALAEATTANFHRLFPRTLASR